MKTPGFLLRKLFNASLWKHYIFLVILFLSQEMYSQEYEVYYVKFDFQHSLRIPNNTVSVDIQRIRDSILVHVKSEPMKLNSKKWDKTKLDYSFGLKESDFSKIVHSLKKVDGKDVLSGPGLIGTDGTLCKITYGSFASEISYKVWTPNFSTEDRRLQEYLEACILILKTAKLNPKEIL